MNLVLKSLYIFSSLVLLGAASVQAAPVKRGGVSDGGGDSVGAQKLSTLQIASSVSKLNSWIYPWLYKQQAVKSAFTEKLFENSNNDIFKILQSVSIEVRDTEPCYDSQGQPKDGSIYAKKPHHICISSFSLSSKVDQYNFEAELAALILHEMSHLLGTDEPEAVAIQKAALADFSIHTLTESARLVNGLIGGPQGGMLTKVYAPLEGWQQDPEHYASGRDMLYWNQSWGELYRSLADEQKQVLQFIPDRLLSVFPAYNYKIAILIAFYHAHDSTMDAESRRAFQQRIETTFGDAGSLTVRQIVISLEGWDPGEIYDQVTVKNPTSWEIQAENMRDIIFFLKDIESEVVKMADAKLLSSQ